ncbi:diguanylate cyclase [bacterium]|nr:diguanylate cyclase [bacterium]
MAVIREKKRVLIIDDSVVIQRLVQARLRADGFEVATGNDGSEAIELAKNFQPDVILLDIDMPVMNGFDACRALKDNSTTSSIPVIFLSSQTRTEDKVRGLDIGAIDYVTKPFDPVELRARVRSAYRTKYLLELLEQKAQIDGLTGLYNRAFFDARIKEEMERARRYRHSLALVIFDVDRFKRLNDTYGHSFGDVVLAEVAETARLIARQTDVVARYGGEEFVITLPEQTLEGAAQLAERVREGIEELQLRHNGEKISVTASFGVASTIEVGYESIPELVNTADRMLYAAKESGRNRVCVASKEKLQQSELATV